MENRKKKIRQLIRRNQTSLVGSSWDCFFETISEMKLKYRCKLAWKIIRGVDIRKEERDKIQEVENGNTGVCRN